MVEAIKKFFTTREIVCAWRRTFVALVSKRPDATEPSNYRSINLCTTLYKICAMLMVERMKPVLPCLIYPKQGAFFGGRSITDNVMVAQKFMHDLHQAPGRHCLMLIKLDMEQAYDRVS